MATKKEETKGLTRAQKTTATKGIIKEVLAVKLMRHNELIDEVAKIYAERYEDGENMNDVKGRVGSVLDIMKKESEVGYDGGTYALKARLPLPPAPKTEEVAEEKPKKRARAKKAPAPVEDKSEEKVAEEAPKKRTRAKKAVETPVPVEEKGEVEEKPAPKKRTRKVKVETPVEPEKTEEKTQEKAEEKVAEAPAPVATPVPAPVEAKAEEKQETGLVEKPKAEVAERGVVMDMSFLFGDKLQKTESKPKSEKPVEKTPEKREEKSAPAEKARQAPVEKAAVKTEEKKGAKTSEKSKVERSVKPAQKVAKTPQKPARKQSDKPMTADEKLREEFLKRMRALGGDYFEYYSVYLLERYSMKNGRRLEGLKISGGDHDGGIDGEIELTDGLGFRETIYIQSKNWDPDKGKEENWVVGETLLQQFIGACACRQAKDRKQHARGIFVTTSRFTPDAKRILEDMSDKIVGYDGTDLYETAKECQFGVVRKNGEWVLDEELLAGTKAFFHLL